MNDAIYFMAGLMPVFSYGLTYYTQICYLLDVLSPYINISGLMKHIAELLPVVYQCVFLHS